jgi:hypothetical protein
MIANIQFIIIVGLALAMLIGAAKLLSYGYSDKREACIKAGYVWSPTKYVCTVKP